MATINIQNLLTQINLQISKTTDNKKLLMLSRAVSLLKSGSIFTVATFSELPTASENIGQLYFVENDSILYYSKGDPIPSWTPLTKIGANRLFAWGSNTEGDLGDGTANNSRSIPTLIAADQDYTWCDISFEGYTFSAGVKTDGTLWTWGNNYNGMLGDGTYIDRTSPGTVAGAGTNWCAVSSGQQFMGALKTDGTLWSWGANYNGSLGDGTTVNKSSPGTVAGGGTWSKISMDYYRAFGIKTDGTLWSWGANNCGVLGNGDTLDRSSPGTVAGGGTTWCQVSSGFQSAAAIKTDGTLWTWGRNIFNGSLGDGTIINRCSPGTVAGGGNTWCFVEASNLTDTLMFGIKIDGTLWSWGSNSGSGLLTGQYSGGRCSPGTTIGNFTNWCSISTTNRLGSALKTDGTLWTWSSNSQGGDIGINANGINRYSPGTIFGGGTSWFKVSAGAYKMGAITSETA